MNVSFAILLTLISAFSMGTMGCFSRLTGLPSETVTFFRLFFGAGFLTLLLIFTGQLRLLLRRPTFPVLLNGCFLAGFIIFYVQAMHLTSMANAVMLVYLAPVTASAFAHFFLHERLNPFGWALMGLAMFGFAAMMEFRLDFSSGGDHATGLGCALLSMCCYAGFILINRQIRSEDPVMPRVFYQLLTGSLVMLPFVLATKEPLTAAHLPWLLGVGFVPGFLGITCAVCALGRLPAATFGTLAYFEPLVVILFGWFLFGETLSPLQLTGCAMILTSGCLKARASQTARA